MHDELTIVYDDEYYRPENSDSDIQLDWGPSSEPDETTFAGRMAIMRHAAMALSGNDHVYGILRRRQREKVIEDEARRLRETIDEHKRVKKAKLKEQGQ